VPKSSSANWQPRLRTRFMKASARSRCVTAAVSVSSKQMMSAGMPAAAICASMNAAHSLSPTDWPDRLIAKRAMRPPSACACCASSLSECSTTQRSIAGISW